MMRFKQFLREKWEATLKSPYGDHKPFDVHKNPSKREVQKLVKNSEFGTLRGIVHPNGNAYLWDAAHAIHDDVHTHMKMGDEVQKKHFINVRSDRYDSEYGSDNKNHPWVKKTLSDHRFFHS